MILDPAPTSEAELTATPIKLRKRRKRSKRDTILAISAMVAITSIIGATGYVVWERTATRPEPKPKAVALPPITGINPVEMTEHKSPAPNETKKNNKPSLAQMIQTVKDGKPAAEAITQAAAKSEESPEANLQADVKKDFIAATKLLRDFFLVLRRSDSEMEPLIREPQRVLSKYAAWKTRSKLAPAERLQIGPKFMTLDPFLVVGVPLADGTTRLAVLERSAKGVRLDWESFAIHCERTFAELPAQADDAQTLLRVNAQRSASVPPFATEPGGVTFTLSHPEEAVTLNAYLPPSVLATREQAVRYLAEATQRTMVTLMVYMDADSRAHGWVKIAAVPNVGWVKGLTAASNAELEAR